MKRVFAAFVCALLFFAVSIFGQTSASLTGIVTAEMTTRRMSEADRPRQCPSCGSVIHAAEARFCHHCGAPLG